MKNDLLHVKIVKITLAVIGIFLAIFIYSFLGSKLSGDDHYAPAAYGRDSLEAVAEPVLTVQVWQRNDREFSDYSDLYQRDNSFFYSLIPLEMNAEDSVKTNKTENLLTTDYFGTAHIVFTVNYDGPITGESTPLRHACYAQSSQKIPAQYSSGNNDSVFSAEDGNFSGNETITLSFDNYSYLLADGLDDSTHRDDNVRAMQVRDREMGTDLDFDDYSYVQDFLDVYPDADQKLEDLQRIVFTTYVTVNGMHPTKQDIVMASAELALTSYSEWTLNNEGTEVHDAFIEGGYSNIPYSEVSVVSYTQSDTFSMD